MGLHPTLGWRWDLGMLGLMPQPDHLRCSDADRFAVEQLLNDAYSDGRLNREEHDERLSQVWGAKTFGELTVTTDLVPVTSAPTSKTVGPTDGDHPWAVVDPRGATQQTRSFVAILGSTKRDSDVRVHASNQIVSILGDVHIDMTSAVFEAQSCRINVSAVMGDAVLRVPAGVRVRNEIASILGDTKVKGLEPGEEGPELILTGVCIMGDVKVYGPGHKSFFKKFNRELP